MRERVMKWLQIKRYNWKNYDIFLIAVVLILTFISSYVISIVNSDISLKRQLVGVVMGIVIIGIFSIIDYHIISRTCDCSSININSYLTHN